jgi:ketosteroid isomerase-like protein
MAEHDPETAVMVAAIKEYCRAECEQDKPAFFALFSDDIVHEDPVGYTTRRGKAELEELWSMAAAGNVDLQLIDVIARGNEAMAIMAAETGPADARRRTAPIVDHFRFDADGLIVSVRAFYNFG